MLGRQLTSAAHFACLAKLLILELPVPQSCEVVLSRTNKWLSGWALLALTNLVSGCGHPTTTPTPSQAALLPGSRALSTAPLTESSSLARYFSRANDTTPER